MMVYLMGVPGGWIADRYLGHYRAVLCRRDHHRLRPLHAWRLPGIPFFFRGLVLIVLGTGLLKPNVSTIVGTLYTRDDPRRDAGFSLFYMGINLGAFIAPLDHRLARTEDQLAHRIRGRRRRDGARPHPVRLRHEVPRRRVGREDAADGGGGISGGSCRRSRSRSRSGAASPRR